MPKVSCQRFVACTSSPLLLPIPVNYLGVRRRRKGLGKKHKWSFWKDSLRIQYLVLSNSSSSECGLEARGTGVGVGGVCGGLSPDCHLYTSLLSVLQITQLQNQDDS